MTPRKREKLCMYQLQRTSGVVSLRTIANGKIKVKIVQGMYIEPKYITLLRRITFHKIITSAALYTETPKRNL